MQLLTEDSLREEFAERAFNWVPIRRGSARRPRGARVGCLVTPVGGSIARSAS
jgi:hypothetical protein